LSAIFIISNPRFAKLDTLFPDVKLTDLKTSEGKIEPNTSTNTLRFLDLSALTSSKTSLIAVSSSL